MKKMWWVNEMLRTTTVVLRGLFLNICIQAATVFLMLDFLILIISFFVLLFVLISFLFCIYVYMDVYPNCNCLLSNN